MPLGWDITPCTLAAEEWGRAVLLRAQRPFTVAALLCLGFNSRRQHLGLPDLAFKALLTGHLLPEPSRSSALSGCCLLFMAP